MLAEGEPGGSAQGSLEKCNGHLGSRLDVINGRGLGGAAIAASANQLLTVLTTAREPRPY